MTVTSTQEFAFTEVIPRKIWAFHSAISASGDGTGGVVSFRPTMPANDKLNITTKDRWLTLYRWKLLSSNASTDMFEIRTSATGTDRDNGFDLSYTQYDSHQIYLSEVRSGTSYFASEHKFMPIHFGRKNELYPFQVDVSPNTNAKSYYCYLWLLMTTEPLIYADWLGKLIG